MIKRCAQAIFIFLLVLGTLGSDPGSQRFEKLGHRLVCSCGCNQILLECNHVGCPASDGMRNELTAGIKRSSNDDAVLETFVQKYGPIVLAAPTMTGFNRVAWLMPYLMFALGIGLAAFLVRAWNRRSAPLTAAPPVDDAALEAFRRRARRETEL